MAIYEKFIGRTRESFSSLEDCLKNYKITCGDDFNFSYDVIDVLGTEKPNKRAMLYISSTGEEMEFSFGDVMKMSNKAANYFTSLGIKKDDRVLLVLKRSYLFWFAILGLHKIGAIIVPASNMLMAKDYSYRCNKAKIKCVVITGDGDCTEHFDEGEPDCETVEIKLVTKHKDAGKGWQSFEDGFFAASDEWIRPTGDAATKATDTMLICFSSGTTGYPKIITHNFKYPLGHISTGVFWHHVVDGGLHFAISDTGWMKAFWGKLYGQWMGETALMIYDFDKFDGADILQKLEKYKVTTFCCPPTMYRMILQNDVAKYDLSSIVNCNTAGEALNAEIFKQWKEATGLEIHEGFGMSETPVCISTLTPWMTPVPGAIGLPSPGLDVHILDDFGNNCQRGTVGEICIKANPKGEMPCGILTGYNFDDAETAEAFRGGYFHTGDLAYRDEKGLFVYFGRNDDVIKSSGYRIGPFEIESVMLEHPAVLEVAVTGVPDPNGVRGFLVKATVVLKPGFYSSDKLVKELQNYVKVNTAPYKYPRIIEFVDELPKTISNKIRRVEIREKDNEKK